MEKILAIIEEVLEAKGLGAAAASKAATGSESTINAWKVQQSKGRSRKTTIDNLEAIAEFLDLEFYFGPKRAEPQTQYQVQALDSGDVVVIPYHETMIRHRFAPMHLAVTRTWISKSGADLDALRLLVMQSNVMEPTIPDAALVVIDTSHTEPEDGSSELYGVQVKGSGPTIRRLTRIGDKWIMTCDDPRFAKHIITAETPAQRLAAAPIGRVVAVMSRTVTVQD